GGVCSLADGAADQGPGGAEPRRARTLPGEHGADARLLYHLSHREAAGGRLLPGMWLRIWILRWPRVRRLWLGAVPRPLHPGRARPRFRRRADAQLVLPRLRQPRHREPGEQTEGHRLRRPDLERLPGAAVRRDAAAARLSVRLAEWADVVGSAIGEPS